MYHNGQALQKVHTIPYKSTILGYHKETCSIFDTSRQITRIIAYFAGFLGTFSPHRPSVQICATLAITDFLLGALISKQRGH